MSGKADDRLTLNADPTLLRLQNTWTLHYQSPGTGGRGTNASSWEASVREVANVDSVASFWQLFNHLAHPSDLQSKATLHLFKAGLDPSWEKNPGGGCWTLPLDIGKQLNNAWLMIVLEVVGDVFPDADEILGISVCIRRACRVEIWTRAADNAAANLAIGAAAKKACGMTPGDQIEYQSFANQIGGVSRALYTV